MRLIAAYDVIMVNGLLAVYAIVSVIARKRTTIRPREQQLYTDILGLDVGLSRCQSPSSLACVLYVYGRGNAGRLYRKLSVVEAHDEFSRDVHGLGVDAETCIN